MAIGERVGAVKGVVSLGLTGQLRLPVEHNVDLCRLGFRGGHGNEKAAAVPKGA